MRCGLPGPVTRSFASFSATITFAHIPAGLLYELGGIPFPYSVSLFPRYTTTLSRHPRPVNQYPAFVPEFSANFRPLIARIAITRIPSALAPFSRAFSPPRAAVAGPFRRTARLAYAGPVPARRPPRRTPPRRPAARRLPRPPPRARPRPHPRPQARGSLVPDLYTCLQQHK